MNLLAAIWFPINSRFAKSIAGYNTFNPLAISQEPNANSRFATSNAKYNTPGPQWFLIEFQICKINWKIECFCASGSFLRSRGAFQIYKSNCRMLRYRPSAEFSRPMGECEICKKLLQNIILSALPGTILSAFQWFFKTLDWLRFGRLGAHVRHARTQTPTRKLYNQTPDLPPVAAD